MKWQMRVGKAALDDFDFAQRGGVEMADAGGPHLFEHERRRIGLDRIQRVAGKPVQEPLRRGPEFLRKDAIDRLDRFHRGDGLLDRGKAGNRVDARGCVHAKTTRICGGVCLRQRGRGVKRRNGCQQR